MSGCKKVKLGDVCIFEKGNIGIKKAVPGEYPMVTLAEKRGSNTEFQFDDAAVLVPLVSSTGHGHASMKRIHYQEGKFALGNILVALIPMDKEFLHPYFLYIFLSYFKDSLLVPLMKGAANVSLSITRIKSVEIVVPSYETQIRIIENEKRLRQEKLALTEQFTLQGNFVAKLRQAILQEAIQGKLTEDWRKENLDVEPAGELLKRIKAEKEKLVEEKKIRKEKLLPEISKKEIPFNLPKVWADCLLADCFKVLSTKKNQLKTKDYLNNGIYPIVDQGKKLICGYTDEKDKVFSISSPIIIFGDHTKILKYIDFDFAIGADGTKPLIPIVSIVNAKYFYYALKAIIAHLGTKTYGRHFNILKSSLIPFPPLAEQKVIVEKVEILMQKLDKLEVEIEQNKKTANLLMQSVLKETFLK